MPHSPVAAQALRPRRISADSVEEEDVQEVSEDEEMMTPRFGGEQQQPPLQTLAMAHSPEPSAANNNGGLDHSPLPSPRRLKAIEAIRASSATPRLIWDAHGPSTDSQVRISQAAGALARQVSNSRGHEASLGVSADFSF